MKAMVGFFYIKHVAMLCLEMKKSPGSAEQLPGRMETLWQPYCHH
jgi:hypothetical protein